MSGDNDVKPMIDSDEEEEDSRDPMDIPTSVTIVEEDGSTSVVEDAAVSSILTDVASHPAIQFGNSHGGGVTYRVVGLDDQSTYTGQQSGGVQLLSTNLNGQYYVIGSSQDVLTKNRRQKSAPIIDARALTRVTSKSIVRDEKKRATHNEVERRRRDKINGWINKLSKVVPSCVDESTSTKGGQSKGGILAKACEYIHDLRNTNIRLAATLREQENGSGEYAALRRENAELRRENIQLKQQLGHVEDASTVIIASSNVLRSH